MRSLPLLALMLAALAVQASAAILYNYTIYYPDGTNGVNVTALLVPGHVCGVVESGSPLPHACFKVDGYTVVAAREPAGPARNVTWTVGLNASAPWPFMNESTVYLVARCESSLTSDSGYTYGWLPLSLQALDEPVDVYVENVTVGIYVIYGSSANLYVYADGRLVWSATGVTSASRTLYSLYARNITLYANSTGSSYAIIYYEIYYYPPVYNSTSVTLDYPLVYLEAAGRGSISVSGYNVTFNGETVVLVVSYPPVVAVNGSMVEAQPGVVTVATSCYGSNVTSLAIIHYAVANLTRYEVLSVQSYYYTPPQQQQVVEINASISTAELAEAVSNSARVAAGTLLAIAAVAMVALLPSPYYVLALPVGAAGAALSFNPATVAGFLVALLVTVYRVVREVQP